MLDALDTRRCCTRGGCRPGWSGRCARCSSDAARARHLAAGNGALAEATPIGAWIAGRRARRRHVRRPRPIRRRSIWTTSRVALRPTPHRAGARPASSRAHEQVHMAQLVAETLNGRAAARRGRHGHRQEPGVPAARRRCGRCRRIGAWSSRPRRPRCRTSCSSRTCRWCRRRCGEHAASCAPRVLKGRANYLCLRRWQQLLHAATSRPRIACCSIKTLFWLPRTRTGDRAELHLSPAEEEAW